MGHLTYTTVEDLQNALNAVDEKITTMQLIAAIAYKNGVTQSEARRVVRRQAENRL